MDQNKTIQLEAIETPEIHWEQLRKLMDFQELSYPTLARMSGTPESTLRKLLQGVTKDPRISTMFPVVRALGASFDRLLGLAPERDYAREEATYDVTLMDTMRHQVETMIREREAGVAINAANIAANSDMLKALGAKIADQETRLTDKRTRLHEQEEQIAVLNERITAKDKTIANLEGMYKNRGETIDSLRRDLRMQRIFTTVMALLMILLCGYFVWELLPWNLDKGLTGLWQ